MKKVILLAMLVLGTTAMVNAQTATKSTAPAKEVKIGKHKKHNKKEVAKMEATKTEATKK
ncbi:hypothetical protein [Flavobacterium sp. WC2430]|uniref:hypothetical protein n=1 Tax=Flavobacterium sp. WC2430 TaxID=3234137 RepID=UPI003465F519